MKDENFVLISVATDGGGAPAVAEWIRAAHVTHPALVDEWHTVTELYEMVNVPNAVWIDESGRIVRPAESASAIDLRELDRDTLAASEQAAAEAQQAREVYLAAIGAWVRTGRYALPLEAAKQRLRGPTESTSAAAAHHRLGTYLLREGDEQAAQRHFAESLQLEPDRWTYRRDAWGLADERIEGSTPLSAMGRHATAFWTAVDDLGERPFYPPAELADSPPPPSPSV